MSKESEHAYISMEREQLKKALDKSLKREKNLGIAFATAVNERDEAIKDSLEQAVIIGRMGEMYDSLMGKFTVMERKLGKYESIWKPKGKF